MIYLIEEIWTDWMENHHSNAVGYRTKGYVLTEQEAQDVVASGRLLKKEDFWACGN